jgi:hypothetical protein
MSDPRQPGYRESTGKPASPAIQQVSLLEDKTGTIKFTVWRASRKSMVEEAQTVQLRSVAKNWHEGRVSVAVIGLSSIHVFERGR